MWKKIIFDRSGGHWLFWASALYLTIGMVDIFIVKIAPIEIIQVLWLLVIAMPFYIPPLGRWLNLDVTWDRKMLNWFGKKDKDNVVKFPELKPVPQVEPPKKEEPAKIYYRLGLTDNNRVAFQMGYSEITMNHTGCQQLIDQLKFFQNQLQDEGNEPDDDPDGGLPLPKSEQKAA